MAVSWFLLTPFWWLHRMATSLLASSYSAFLPATSRLPSVFFSRSLSVMEAL